MSPVRGRNSVRGALSLTSRGEFRNGRTKRMRQDPIKVRTRLAFRFFKCRRNALMTKRAQRRERSRLYYFGDGLVLTRFNCVRGKKKTQVGAWVFE